jgi:hypothetical protein
MIFPRQNIMNDVFHELSPVLRPSLAQLKVYRNIYEISETLNAAYSPGEVKRGKYNKHRLDFKVEYYCSTAKGGEIVKSSKCSTRI